jgi:hypothetical protein
MSTERKDWQESGNAPMTRKQQKLLNAACGDLSDMVRWHGVILSKDDWRHCIAATILGDRLIPGINTGEGHPGLIRLPRSSLEFTKSQATEAIRMAFDIGDYPSDQGLGIDPIRWGPTVCLARFVTDEPL